VGPGKPASNYFGARYFSGAQGRFTTPDWSAIPMPVPYADLRLHLAEDEERGQRERLED
jgi:hypothetical protein